MITVGYRGFYNAKEDDEYYQYIYNNNKTDYWNKINEAGLSEEFKELYFSMVSKDPKSRPTIERILKHDWFKEILIMKKEQLNELENEINNEFKIREPGVRENLKKKIIKKNNDSDAEYNRKSGRGENIFNFDFDIKPKFIKSGKYMNYYIQIEYSFDTKKFLNKLCDNIIEKFGENNCDIIADKSKKHKIDVYFDGDKFIMRIKLYQTPEGYLLRFVKKAGNTYDFIEKYLIISNLVSSTLDQI